MNIVNIGYQSTNYYLLDIKGGKLMIDCGWPGTYPQLSAEIKRKGSAIKEIQYLIVTHFHPDHAGLVQELKNLGVKHILLDVQVDFIPQLTDFFSSKHFPYIEITPQDSTLLSVSESRSFLAEIGLSGEIIHTPGHSDDSITLILDEGLAFVGDLQPEFVLPVEDSVSRASWDKIHQHKIKTTFHSHGR